MLTLQNAGHLPNAIRSPSYHTYTDTSRYHLLAIDYRGFGQSSGSPTEQGLITDASALVDFAMHTAGVSPDRIVLLGQSLGTAVASGVAERYAVERGVDFAGVVLVAAFSSLPTMLAGYAIAGLVPVLRPLAFWPAALRWFMSFVVDKWESADRLARMVKAVHARGGHLRLSLVHAADDWDIPYREDDKLFASAVSGFLGKDIDVQRLASMKSERTLEIGTGAFVTHWKEGDITVTQELFPYGGRLTIPLRTARGKTPLTISGHNKIMMHAPVSLAVMRSFGHGEPSDPEL